MAKSAYVYSGTDWVPLASEVTNLTAYQTKSLAQASNRNLIINGAMQVAQRSTSVASITTDSYFTVDRWNFGNGAMGTYTMSQESDGPTGSGFAKSAKVLCTTADASPASGDYIFLAQRFEGQNLQSIRKGTASAQQLTVSFWVKSNKTGTYVCQFEDTDNNRAASKSYTVSSSDVWEYKTLTFPADTTGALTNDNNLSLILYFWLGGGSSYTSGTLQTTWNTMVDANRAAGQTNLSAATSNYFQITGVQLEVGDTATPFEFKDYGTELAQCQRYYYRNAPGNLNGNHCLAQVRSTTNVEPVISFPVTMRAVPSILEFSNLAILRAGTSVTAITAATLPTDESTTNSAKVSATTNSSGASAGQVVTVTNNNSTSGYIAFSAEL